MEEKGVRRKTTIVRISSARSREKEKGEINDLLRLIQSRIDEGKVMLQQLISLERQQHETLICVLQQPKSSYDIENPDDKLTDDVQKRNSFRLQETINLDKIEEEEEETNINKMVELDVASWEDFKSKISHQLESTIFNTKNTTSNDVASPESSTRTPNTSILLSIDAKAPENTPITCDPFLSQGDQIVGTGFQRSSSTEFQLDELLIRPPPLFFASFDPYNIIQFLSLSDILVLSEICKSYYKLINSNASLWKKVYAYYERKLLLLEEKYLGKEEDSNVWNAPTLDIPTGHVKGVLVLNELVRKLIPTTESTEFVLEVALSTFREFSRPWSQFIRKLIQRYMVPPPSSFSMTTEDWKREIVAKVCPKVLSVLLRVIPNLEEIPTELLNLLQVFVRGFVLPSYPDAANALELAILHQLDLIDTQMRLNACNLHLLPEHIILRIFSHLGFEDLCCVSQVSKACLNASMNGPLWRNLYDYYDLMLKEKGQDDTNIWEDQGNVTYKDSDKTIISHASLNKLVEFLTPQSSLPDSTDVKTFLLTYSTFTTAHQLVRKLIQRYEVPYQSSEMNYLEWSTKIKKPIQLRVIKILKIFIEEQTDMKPNTKMLLKIFIKRLLAEDPAKAKPLIASLKKSSRALLTAPLTPLLPKETTFSALRKQVQKLETTIDPDTLFETIAPEEIARQLTLIEFDLYAAIKPTEFFKQAWAKPKLQHKAPKPKKVKKRVKRMTVLIQVAKALRTFHNYHTLMALLSALNENAVHRLRFTKERIPAKQLNIFKELEELMSADGSYKTFRIELSQSEPPCLPYLGVYLRDLTYFEEDGGTHNANDANLINFKQRKNVFSVIYLIQNYQHKPYSFKPIPNLYSTLQQLEGKMETEEIFKLSLEREPRNCTANDIE